MRWSALMLAAGIVAGCENNQPPAHRGTRSSGAPTGENTATAEMAALRSQNQPEKDKEPPHFDPASGARTLRWIAELTADARQIKASRAKAAEQLRSIQSQLARCLKETINWKVPVESIDPEGRTLFAPFRTTNFPDHSDKHPEMTLQILPWNKTATNPLFECPPYPWLPTVNARQEAVSVHGTITSITFKDPYIWYVSLTDIHLSFDADPSSSSRLENRPPDKLDPADADRSFAWLRQQCYAVLDPFLTPPDREHQKQILRAHLRDLEGTKVRWQWPAVVANESAVALQTLQIMDYAKQVTVKMGVLLKQPGPTGKAVPAARTEYNNYFVVAPGAKGFSPDAIAKIRESKKAMVTGKVAKILTADYGVYPPPLLEIVVRLDEVGIAP